MNNGELSFNLNQALQMMHDVQIPHEPMIGGRTLTQPSSLAISHMNIQDSSNASLKPKNFRNTLNVKKNTSSKNSIKVDKKAKT